MIVADASAVLEVLLNTERAIAISEKLFAPGQTIHAPHLLDIEVLQVLRRYARTAVIATARANEAIQDYSNMRLSRYPHNVLLDRMWELRQNVSAYDAAYIALAEALAAPLVTCDRALASFSGSRSKIVVF